MSKVYSSKALPAGTVLREWRLEEVLGVGGFGIVYKGRGIYFGELVAIKEYFPSSISERNEDDTVVPVDSDSEEVHALGLKKFVEEAKLLWNLSTPTRHPNIVSVRSLFEVHGTAYMVMDFEDGVSLSRMLKRGDRFNEASLSNLVKPIAEGLERAHRVGVLHRDIKPPNILVTEDGRPVLIDFGSARFESADATSTKVTFHTPPYAAIEQYVKTYQQGPWTDIYALGVVLYECVTGQKPADVLERLHGEDETRLAEGNWPGYSKTFLAAIDAALIIKPTERPQSIADWMALFDGATAPAVRGAGIDDEEATRVAAYADAPDEIVPVAPPLPGFSPTEKPATNVPDDPRKVRFKRAGQDTGVDEKADRIAQPATASPLVPGQEPSAAEVKAGGPAPSEPAEPEAAKPLAAKAADDRGKPKAFSRPLVIGLAGLATAAGGGGWLMFGGGQSTKIDEGLVEQSALAAPSEAAADDLVGARNSLLADARKLGAPAAVVEQFATATDVLNRAAGAPEANPAAAGDPMRAASAQFAAGLLRDAEAQAGRLASAVPWATNASAASSEPANRQTIGRTLRSSLRSLRSASAAAGQAADPGQALEGARTALEQWNNFAVAARSAYRAQRLPTTEADPAARAILESTAAAEEAASPEPSATGVSAIKKSQFNSVVSRARQLVRQVRALPSGSRPGSRATDAEREAYRAREADKDAARDYERYLDRLESSMRGAKSDGEADQFISQALQTEDYLRVMLARSSSN